MDTLSVEARLVERAKAQDETAFEQIMNLYADRLYNYILRMVGNATDAEDLVQETFLRAYQGLPTFDGRASLGTWLYRIATNLCIDHQRRRARRVPTVSYSMQEDEDGEPAEWEFPDLQTRLSRAIQTRFRNGSSPQARPHRVSRERARSLHNRID